MAYNTYTDDELRIAVQSSKSMLATFKKLGLSGGGRATKSLVKNIQRLNIDRSHWTCVPEPHISIEEACVEHSTFRNITHLKLRLFREGVFEEKCLRCGIDSWMGEKLTLHLHHKNGNTTDNRLDNLEILCPNCHSVTPNYSGKNIKKRRKDEISSCV